jgi:hypothetical protein
MANITPEQQERFDKIIDEIFVLADPISTDSIITKLKELWEEIKSTESHQ